MRPLIYLTVRRIWNSIKNIPKKPRVLIPVLVIVFGLGIQGFFFLFLAKNGVNIDTPTAFLPTNLIDGKAGQFIATIRGMLLLITITSIIGALGDGTLFFSQNDIDFLFPAPLSRRAVLAFKMMARYAGLLFTAFYFPLAVGGSIVAAEGGNMANIWVGILGMWLFLIGITNFSQSALLARGDRNETEEERTRRERIRKIAGIAFLIVVLGIPIYFVYFTKGGQSGDFFPNLLRLINSQAVSVVLAPIAWASDLFGIMFRGWQIGDAGRLVGLTVFNAVSFFLLFSRERDFYENALEVSGKVMRIRNAARRGDSGSIISQMARDGKLAKGIALKDFGGGWRSIVWKDAVSISRIPPRSWITLLFLASMPALVGLINDRATSRFGDVGVLLWVAFFLLNMSGIFLMSLRDMLLRADISKALPISPIRLLAAELALSVAQLTVLGWFSLGVLSLAMVSRGGSLGSLSIVVALILPSFAALLLFVQTSFVLLYPSRTDQAQQSIGGLVGVFFTLLSIAPPLILLAVLHFTGVPILLTALLTFLLNTAIAFLALGIAAVLWQRYDPTD